MFKNVRVTNCSEPSEPSYKQNKTASCVGSRQVQLKYFFSQKVNRSQNSHTTER